MPGRRAWIPAATAGDQPRTHREPVQALTLILSAAGSPPLRRPEPRSCSCWRQPSSDWSITTGCTCLASRMWALQAASTCWSCSQLTALERSMHTVSTLPSPVSGCSSQLRVSASSSCSHMALRRCCPVKNGSQACRACLQTTSGILQEHQRLHFKLQTHLISRLLWMPRGNNSIQSRRPSRACPRCQLRGNVAPCLWVR